MLTPENKLPEVRPINKIAININSISSFDFWNTDTICVTAAARFYRVVYCSLL